VNPDPHFVGRSGARGFFLLFEPSTRYNVFLLQWDWHRCGLSLVGNSIRAGQDLILGGQLRTAMLTVPGTGVLPGSGMPVGCNETPACCRDIETQ
jgi:hypothetical protein